MNRPTRASRVPDTRPHPGERHVSQDVGVALAGDERLDHPPGRFGRLTTIPAVGKRTLAAEQATTRSYGPESPATELANRFDKTGDVLVAP